MSDQAAVARNLRVLLVDDDPDQRQLLRTLFTRAGIVEIAEAVDGTEAVAKAGEYAPDLIVLDLAMPGASGVDILPELRHRVADAQVVVVSNFPRWRLAEIVRRRGALGYVEKRVRPERIVEEILFAAALAERAAALMSREFASEAASPRNARRFVRELLTAADDDLVGSAELLVAELVNNAVVHAASAPTVGVHVHDDLVRVEVFDDDPRLPRPQPKDDFRASGRGLRILDSVATRWGADPSGAGKVIWFELERT